MPSSAAESRAIYPFSDHPLRHVLNNELHARPPVTLSPPERVSHIAIHSGERESDEEHASLLRLCERYGVTPPHPGVNHFLCDLGPFRLKWERHTEFRTYTFFMGGGFADPPVHACAGSSVRQRVVFEPADLDVHTMGRPPQSLDRALAHHLAHALIARHLPDDRHGLGHAAQAVGGKRLARQPRPQHKAVGRGFAGRHPQRKRIAAASQRPMARRQQAGRKGARGAQQPPARQRQRQLP